MYLEILGEKGGNILAINYHEERFVNAFIRKNKRERWLFFFAKAKRRHKIIDSLYHCDDLINTRPIPSRHQYVKKICEILQDNGSPADCHIISTYEELDRKGMPLINALEAIAAGSHMVPSIISCIPGKLAFYEGEDFKNSLLLKSRG